MNRTDRLLAIVLELQGKGHQRAEDLAETFETSKRTIYRDLQALGQAGVPLISTTGRGYSLMKGYFLPPLSCSADKPPPPAWFRSVEPGTWAPGVTCDRICATSVSNAWKASNGCQKYSTVQPVSQCRYQGQKSRATLSSVYFSIMK